MPLPQSCDQCVFLRNGLCRRHAPSSGYQPDEPAFWPIPKFRCGSGDTRGEGPTKCGRCLFWHRPDGKAITPDYHSSKDEAWWRDSGYCVRWAPSPSGEESRESYPRAVNGVTDECGDGEVVRRA